MIRTKLCMFTAFCFLSIVLLGACDVFTRNAVERHINGNQSSRDEKNDMTSFELEQCESWLSFEQMEQMVQFPWIEMQLSDSEIHEGWMQVYLINNTEKMFMILTCVSTSLYVKHSGFWVPVPYLDEFINVPMDCLALGEFLMPYSSHIGFMNFYRRGVLPPGEYRWVSYVVLGLDPRGDRIQVVGSFSIPDPSDP